MIRTLPRIGIQLFIEITQLKIFGILNLKVLFCLYSADPHQLF